jgi:hypothetical protein
LKIFNLPQAKVASGANHSLSTFSSPTVTPINNIVSRANDQIKSLITLSHAERASCGMSHERHRKKSINHDLNHSAKNATFLHITMGSVIVFREDARHQVSPSRLRYERFFFLVSDICENVCVHNFSHDSFMIYGEHKIFLILFYF